MKQYIWKKMMLPCSLALAILLALSACAQNTSPSTAVPSAEVPTENTTQDPAESTESPMPERTISDTILLGGEKTEVFLDVSNGEITFWDQSSAGNLLAVAKYPEVIPGAAEALNGFDFTDLDNDGNSDMTASFQFEDGTFASLVWFFSNGGFVYNEEFSQLPGDALIGE